MLKRRADPTITLGGTEITDVRPVIDGRLTTKAGRVSMRGRCAGKQVKIFECANSAHASFVASVMDGGPTARYFPAVVAVDGEFVVCEWVDGDRVTARRVARDRKLCNELGDLVDGLHDQSVPDRPPFDYVEDYIRPRFARACRALGLSAFFERVDASWRVLNADAGRWSVSHPDLSPANLIVPKDGGLKVVDNELLNVSRAPWFDELHVIHYANAGNGGGRSAAQMDAFMKPLIGLALGGHNRHLIDVWLMRMTGARFVDGALNEIVSLATIPARECASRIGIWKTLQACYPDLNIGDLE